MSIEDYFPNEATVLSYVEGVTDAHGKPKKTYTEIGIMSGRFTEEKKPNEISEKGRDLDSVYCRFTTLLEVTSGGVAVDHTVTERDRLELLGKVWDIVLVPPAYAATELHHYTLRLKGAW